MRRIPQLLAVVCLAVAAACARRAMPPCCPPSGQPAAFPPGDLWTARPGVWRIRQSSLVEAGERRIPLQGFLELDTAKGSARLAGMDDMGTTLFVLSVTPGGARTEFLSPLLGREGEFDRLVADSLRRIYLEPRSDRDGPWRPLPDGRGWLLDDDGRTFNLAFDGGGRLLSKEATGRGESWRVWYDDYSIVGGLAVPGKIVLEDRRGGWRLTVRQESARRIDE